MSPDRECGGFGVAGFPRASGDEPRVSVRIPAGIAFSPRERG